MPATDPILPIRTPRLTVRMMTVADAAVMASYRNMPDVAAHQLWDLPYTVADAEGALSDQFADDDLVLGGRYQLAIVLGDDPAGEVVGDVYTAIDERGGFAELGYTLFPRHQGHGYASEATAAVAAALVDRLGIRRLYGELDPVNVASQRVLERVGLEFEALTRLSFWWRGSLVDNLSYAATATSFDQWRNRPRQPPGDVTLAPIDWRTHHTYTALQVHYSQRRFVADNATSLADALYPEHIDGAPVAPWVRGITADGIPVGLVMTAEVTDVHPEPYLWRLMIDRLHQRRGIAGRVIEQLQSRYAGSGVGSMLTSWVDGPGSPRPFYERIGFEPTGQIVDGEVEARWVW